MVASVVSLVRLIRGRQRDEHRQRIAIAHASHGARCPHANIRVLALHRLDEQRVRVSADQRIDSASAHALRVIVERDHQQLLEVIELARGEVLDRHQANVLVAARERRGERLLASILLGLLERVLEGVAAKLGLGILEELEQHLPGPVILVLRHHLDQHVEAHVRVDALVAKAKRGLGAAADLDAQARLERLGAHGLEVVVERAAEELGGDLLVLAAFGLEDLDEHLQAALSHVLVLGGEPGASSGSSSSSL